MKTEHNTTTRSADNAHEGQIATDIKYLWGSGNDAR
jgi:hypothetical protein